MSKSLLVLSLWLAFFGVKAQDFTFGQLTNEDRLFDRNKIDSNANAVYLDEYGTSRLIFDSETGNMRVEFYYHAKIKIFNKEGFKQANIVIPIYNGDSDSRKEMISELKASTFNFENGRYEESFMDKKAIFTEKRSKYLSLQKFTLPNIRENSIIEYSYMIESPYIFNFKTWEFQGDIPKLNSVYVAFIPANYNYNVSLRGFYKLTDNKAELSKECLRIAGKEMDCSKLTYTLKNIPAFVEEDYMTASSNYKSAIYFELAEVHYLNGSSQKYTKTWQSVDNELTGDKNFGGQMKRKDAFKEIMPQLIANAATDLDKARNIYDYLKKQLRWNNYYGKYSETNIKNVLENRTGNVADINLSLIAAMSAAGLDAEAVIISTRENGMVNKLYPVMSEFNYVIAKVNIQGTSYLLDATEPLAPFGLLPLRCINDQGRVINLKKPSYWIDLKASKKSLTNHILTGELYEDGKIKGTITTSRIGYDGINQRKEIKKYNSIEAYVEKLDERLTNIKIKNFKISNIDSVENALIEEYEVEFSVYDPSHKEQSYINPFFINPIRKNPFNLKERTYPVDLGAAHEERLSINLQLPANYQVKEKPQDLSLGLPNNMGRYLLQISLNDRNLLMSQVLQFNKAIYTSEEYHYLKEFYNRIIQTQKMDILLANATK
jgi:Fe-S cluster assembly iron-binding protein IscA